MYSASSLAGELAVVEGEEGERYVWIVKGQRVENDGAMVGGFVDWCE